MKRSALVSLLFAIALLGACDAETSLEPTPEVIRGSVCPRPHEEPGRVTTGPWGTVTPISNGVEYQVNEGYTVTICAKGGSLGDGYNTVTVTGPQSGTLSTPENAGGNIPELSHYSVTGIIEGGTTSSSSSSSSSSSTSTSSSITTTTELVTSTTTDETTTLTEAEVTTTEAGDTTTTAAGDTTTTAAGDTTTTAAGDTTTTAAGDTTTTTIEDVTITTDPGATTTTSEEGPPVTEGEGPGDPTTTVEVGAGGVTTTPEGEGEGTLDPTQETTPPETRSLAPPTRPFPVPAPGRCRSAVWPACCWGPEPSCCCCSGDGLERTDPASQSARSSR